MARVTTRRQQWLGCGGCLLVSLVVAVLVVPLAGVLGKIAVIAACLAVTAAVVPAMVARRRSIAAFRAAYAHAGKDVLVVYTDSPHWKDYIEAHWLPRWANRAVVFDRSKPWRAEQPEARLWRSVAGAVEHTPVVIVAPPRGRVQIVRFYLAFRDFKHGKDRRLRAAEARLARLLGETPP